MPGCLYYSCIVCLEQCAVLKEAKSECIPEYVSYAFV